MRNNAQTGIGTYRFQTKGSTGGAFAGKSLRMGYDLVTPGRLAEDIQVKANITQGIVEVIAKANPRPPFDMEGLVDKFGYNKVKADLTFTLPFDFDKYDADSLKVACHSGITRIFAVVPEATDMLELIYDDGVGVTYWGISAPDEIVELSAIDLD